MQVVTFRFHQMISCNLGIADNIWFVPNPHNSNMHIINLTLLCNGNGPICSVGILQEEYEPHMIPVEFPHSRCGLTVV